MPESNTSYQYPYPKAPESVRRGFANQKVMKLFNAHLASLAPGQVEIEMDFQSSLTQQNGYLHAGVVTTLIDSACGFAAFSLIPEGSHVLSVEFKVNLLAPARGQRFLARGLVLKAGRTLTICQGTLLSFQDDIPTTAALMQATMMCLPHQ